MDITNYTIKIVLLTICLILIIFKLLFNKKQFFLTNFFFDY